MILIIIALVILISITFWYLSRRFEKGLKDKDIAKTLKGKRSLVSILIPAYRSEETIGRTLDSVKRSDYPNKEVIVINDSDDRTPEIARRYGARVIQNTKRQGKGIALNIGAKRARGDLLLFLDSDTELEPDTLSKLVSSFYHYQAKDPRTAMIVPKYAGSNQHITPAKISHLEQCAHQSWIRAQMNMGSILSIRGSCVLIPKDIFEKTKGFRSTVLEDGDFVARLHGLGYSIKYEPRACARIREPESFRELLKAKKRYGKGTLFCTLRHKRVYLASKQAVISFYPGFAIIALIILFLVTTPLTSLLTAILILCIIPAIGALSMKFSSKTSTMTSNDHYMKLFSLSIAPIVVFTYLLGVASGIRDKLMGKPELKFKDW